MLVVNSYDLYYTHQIQPQHLLTVAKSSIAANALSRTENAQLAEFFLRELDAFNQVSEKRKWFSVGNERASADQALSSVHHIHHAKEEEIKRRFLSEIDESKAAELLYKLEVERELMDGSFKNTEICIKL